MLKRKRKTVLISCSKSEYDFVLENLNQIVDLEKEEPLFPFEFLLFHKKLESNIEKEMFTGRIREELRCLFYKRWYFKKLQHFKDTAELADEIAIIESDITTDLDDLAEKKEEIDYAINLKNKPLRIIKRDELTYQKVR